MKKILRIALSIIFGSLSYVLCSFLYNEYLENINFFEQRHYNLDLILSLSVTILVIILFYITISSIIAEKIFNKIKILEETFLSMSLKEILINVGGILIGLVLANLLGIAVLQYRIVGTLIVLALNLVLGYLGYEIAQRKKEEIKILETCATNEHGLAKPKILDTSVIIDGRILDILKTGLIEGKILIPNFVLEELRHIADSSDALKRNRGRRGLDILNEIQKQLKVPVEIVELDYKDITEVDSKLLKMAQQMDAIIVTNDFNLNKVADFQGVFVFNINELANAIKPVVLPGEDMEVTIIKDGKENGQGIGYLNDGTMIVVEGGHRYIGETIKVFVTSVLQTAAGRMIFTKTKEEKTLE
ncbi:PIN/TRAM domain-containing protein [Defluviitalea phaphyphila]|uniref:PIN/TRAM domain-containing protein n=1 Tax=Defluviitalea phaphyphila TaxID=1473580 RepID=UPI00072FEC0B|nr:PIN domain-containing protein [Defluviitalea phaphyphila]